MSYDETLPSSEFAFEFLKKMKVPYHVRRHSLKVTDKALEIAEKITKIDLDVNLIEIGALLHDVGRAKTHGFKHAIIGAQILREHGFSEKLARICETHILGGLDKIDAVSVNLPEREFLPQSIEEKIICLADKHMAGTREVSIEQRFNNWFVKYGKTQILIKAKKRIEDIQAELKKLM
ncbi:MAG: HDIG domain-containing metalloprotein [Promethearchaeota archaeon]